MDSINKNQPEENHENLSAVEAGKKIKEMVDKSSTCFFTTKPVSNESESFGTRPMNVLKADEDGTLWFLSARDSYKNQELALNSTVELHFKGSEHSDFLYLKAKANVFGDPQKIKELWNPLLKTWFTEGVDDPRITVIEVKPNSGYYWDTKNGNTIAGIKMMLGALMGKTLDDSIEGKVEL